MMQCQDDVFNTIATILLEGIEAGFVDVGLPAIIRSYIGVGPVPAEGMCPELVVWVSNVRFYDAASPDTLQENRLLDHFGMAFDVNARISQCYIESDKDGNDQHSSVLHGWAQQINRYGHTAYLRGVQALINHPDLDCIASLTPRPAEPFSSGMSAGFQYSVSVGIL